MTAIPMRRQGNHLVAVDELSREELVTSLKDRDDCVVRIVTKRSRKQLLYAWALATLVAEMVDWIVDKDHAMYLLKLKAKHFDTYVDKDGSILLSPRSIAEDKCPQRVFNRVLGRMVDYVVTELVPGLEKVEVRREMEQRYLAARGGGE